MLIENTTLCVRQHCTNGCDIAFDDFSGATQLTFIFGGFFGQNIAFERLSTFDRTTCPNDKTFFGTALGFHFRHSFLLQNNELKN